MANAIDPLEIAAQSLDKNDINRELDKLVVGYHWLMVYKLLSFHGGSLHITTLYSIQNGRFIFFRTGCKHTYSRSLRGKGERDPLLFHKLKWITRLEMDRSGLPFSTMLVQVHFDCHLL